MRFRRCVWAKSGPTSGRLAHFLTICRDTRGTARYRLAKPAFFLHPVKRTPTRAEASNKRGQRCWERHFGADRLSFTQ